jgi:hypothetical protein
VCNNSWNEDVFPPFPDPPEKNKILSDEWDHIHWTGNNQAVFSLALWFGKLQNRAIFKGGCLEDPCLSVN